LNLVYFFVYFGLLLTYFYISISFFFNCFVVTFVYLEGEFRANHFTTISNELEALIFFQISTNKWEPSPNFVILYHLRVISWAKIFLSALSCVNSFTGWRIITRFRIPVIILLIKEYVNIRSCLIIQFKRGHILLVSENIIHKQTSFIDHDCSLGINFFKGIEYSILVVGICEKSYEV
jgi:hypothetical protein